MKRLCVIPAMVFFAILFCKNAVAQKDSVEVSRLMLDGEKYFTRDSYDSALQVFEAALAILRKSGRPTDFRLPILHNYIGDIYRVKEKTALSHDHLSQALKIARLINAPYEKETALFNLLQLHRDIVTYDLPFPYPAVAETEVAEAWFQVIQLQDRGDSIDAIVGAGTLDGVGDTLRTADLYTHISPKDTLFHRDLDFVGAGRILKVTPNQTHIRMKKHAQINLLKGDFAIIRASVPVSWRKLFLRDFMLTSLYLQGNYRQSMYHYRYMYYYGDSLVESEVFETMKSAVNEVVDMYGDDTTRVAQFSKKNTAGIFHGMNVIKAMSVSDPGHIRLFLNFVRRFSAKYIANDYKFAETYATWIINNTPLDEADVKPYLLKLSPAERLRQATFLSEQISENNLIEKWLDEGMQQNAIEDLDAAARTAQLLTGVTEVALPGKTGWGEYLYANIEKKFNRHERADSFLSTAAEKFRLMQNQEGLDWIRNTREQWSRDARIEVGVQNGHILPYIIEQSRNPRYFATGGKDNLVKIWDRTLGKEILTLRGHQAEINALHYSPNGRYLVSVAEDSLVCVWNAYNYTLMYHYKSPTTERTVRFSPDNKYLVTGGSDSLIRFREVQTGTVVKTFTRHKSPVNGLAFHPVFPQVLYSAGADSMVYKWSTISNEMLHWYKHSGRALSVQLSPNGKYMSVVSNDSVVHVWNTEENRKMFWGAIYAYKNNWSAFYATETFSPDSRYIAYSHKRDSFLVIRISDLYERVYSAELKGHHLMDLQFSNDGQSLYSRYDLGGPLRIYNFVGWDIKESPRISWRDIRPYGNIVTSVQFTNDDQGLVVLHSEIAKVDLSNGNYDRLFYGYSLIDNAHLLLDDENIGTYIDNARPIVYFYDYKKLEIVKQFGLPDTERLACWDISPGSRYCYLASNSGLVKGWDTDSGQELFAKDFTGGEEKIIAIRFDPFDDRVFLTTEEGMLIAIHAGTGELVFRIPIKDPGYITSTRDYVFVTTHQGKLVKIDKQKGEVLYEKVMNQSGDGLYHIATNRSGDMIAMINGAHHLTAMRVRDDSILFHVKDHEFGATMLAISHDGKQVATAGLDSKVNLYDARTGDRLVDFHFPMEKGVMISDREGHYLASRHTLDAILFTYNNTAFSFDQFDVRLNRPDIILEKIGRADSTLLKSYRAAFQKRLQRSGLREQDLANDVHLPVVRLQDRHAVQTVTTRQELRLVIECSDSRYPLQSLQVLVNNTPVLGVKGRDLSKLNALSTEQELLVPLSTGNNNIKVYCTNARGVSSLRESFDVFSKYTPDQPARTYYIGIGTAQYKDSRMNLQYSAKDIRDLAVTFDNLYYDLSIDTLIDTKATRENILALKKKLMQTTVNDRVILAVTGHGLLSDSLDFYYATHDVDFNKPEKRGVKYEELENLLNDIPARQKLMLIDACHSGALDKDELLALRADSTTVIPTDTTVKGIAPRGFGVRKKERMEANSSFEMMQSLFTDLSGGNGAVIISAAGGMEYAFESGQWNNGVFTYCVRKGIEEKAADTGGNLDGKVSVQELLRYVSREVSELTNGKQKPTSRRENIDFEWNLRN